MVPALASDIVSRIEKLGHQDVAEVADDEERGGLHLHDDRPLGPPRLDLGTRLAEDGVMLLNEVQRQEAEVGTLRDLTDRQRAELDQQKQRLAEQEERLQKLEALLARQAEAPKP